MTTSHTWTISIDRGPQDVFAVVGDIERHHEFSPYDYTAKKTSDGPIGVGTTYESRGYLPGKGKQHLEHVTITAYEPGKRIAWDAVDPDGPVVPSDFVLTPEGSGTKVERTTSIPKPEGFQGFMWPLIFPALVKPAIQKNLKGLKSVVETGSA